MNKLATDTIQHVIDSKLGISAVGNQPGEMPEPDMMDIYPWNLDLEEIEVKIAEEEAALKHIEKDI